VCAAGAQVRDGANLRARPPLADIGATIADDSGMYLPRAISFLKEMTQEDGAAWVFHCPVEARAGSCIFGA
jgi:hypothetical protein